MKFCSTFLPVLIYFSMLESCCGQQTNKLMIVLFDGLRYDFFNRMGMLSGGFQSLIDSGSRAEFSTPTFPTASYINYYSLMTGLYPENHGFVGNFMYDEIYNKTFFIGRNPEYSDPIWWEGAEPFWITATKQGKKVNMYHWPNCEVKIFNTLPEFCAPIDWSIRPDIVTLRASIRHGLYSLHNDSADISIIYHEDPDNTVHWLGIDSINLTRTLQQIDLEVANLRASIRQLGMENTLDLIIASDHGHIEVPEENWLNLTDVLTIYQENIVRYMDNGPVFNLWVTGNPGIISQFIQDLEGVHQNLTVYRKEDIPDRWHYKHHYRVSDIIVVADGGYMFLYPGKPTRPHREGVGYFVSTHGYDNEVPQMRGVFMAEGPNFKQGNLVAGFEIVDIYQVLCYLMGMPCQPHNGTWAKVDDMFRKETTDGAPILSSGALYVIVIAIWTMILNRMPPGVNCLTN